MKHTLTDPKTGNGFFLIFPKNYIVIDCDNIMKTHSVFVKQPYCKLI